MVDERIWRGGAGPARWLSGTKQRPLHEARVGPDTVVHEGCPDFAAFAGPLAAVERQEDGRDQADGRGMIAKPARRNVGRGPGRMHVVHQPGPGVVGRHVVARLFGLFALLAVAGHHGVDQTWVERLEVFVSNPKPALHLRLVVGDQHVGPLDEAREDGVPGRRGQIQRQ